MIQQIMAWAIVVVAAAWLVRRYVKRRAAETCCGEPECPVAKEMLRDMPREPESSGHRR